MIPLGLVLRDARSQLSETLSLELNVAALEAQILLAHTFNKSRTYLLAHPEVTLHEVALSAFAALLQRRLKGEPLAYILGRREFYGLEFYVTPDVLIPRPETELLVELALALMPDQQPIQVLDLGTGSGAIALAIAKLRPCAVVTAVDSAPKALKVAQRNADRLALSNVRFIESDWFRGLNHSAPFNLIVSNPPYVAQNDPHLFQGDVQFEPRQALQSGADGLSDIRSIAQAAQRFLAPHGQLLLEHGYNQQVITKALLLSLGYTNVTGYHDFAGQPRVTCGKRAQNMMK